MSPVVKLRTYRFLDIDYPAVITFKRIRNIILRTDREMKSLRISAPYFTSLASIDRMVIHYLPRLLKKNVPLPSPSGEGWIYLLGEKVQLSFPDEASKYEFLKAKALPLFEERVRYFEAQMNVFPPYKVKTHSMKSRYGVNSKRTHSVTIQTELYHFSLPIIDSVIVHELAHHFVFDHSDRFYEVVYRYCPDYKRLHAKLRKKIYE